MLHGSGFRQCGEGLFHRGQDPFHNDPYSGGIGVDPICQVQLGAALNAIKKKGIEQDAMAGREARVNGIKGRDIIRSVIAWRQHAGEQHSDVPLLQFRDDFIERLFGDGGIDAAQRIVRPQFENHQIGIFGHAPIQPLQAAAGRIARNAGILDADIQPPLLQCGFENIGKGVILPELVPGREGIAKGNDFPGLGVGWHCQYRDSEEAQNCKHSG